MYDRWRDRVANDPRLGRRFAVAAPVALTLLAGILRMFNLAHPHEVVFDETYYVKDAWSQWLLGYPADWPPDANERFAAGQVDGFLDTASFIVHPPLGKWLIGAGMWIFGPESSFGWRFAVALLGTATVLVLYLAAKAMTGSVVFASVAGLLIAIDGLSIVLSRVALLDGLMTFFIVLGFLFVVLDRRRLTDRLAHALGAHDATDQPPAWGPMLWNRPWLLAAGAALGAATAVKWSGLYALAAFGIYIVVADALVRRRLGVRLWPLAALRQGVASFLLLVPIALTVYLLSWSGWLLTDGGRYRQAATEDPAQGLWSWVPLPLQSLWTYHQAIYKFHVGLTSAHSYSSPAWQWPLLLRPTSMYWHQDKSGEAGCTLAGSCVQAVSSIPNPLIWWAGVAAVVYLVYRFVVTPRWRYAMVLTAVAATYVPWLLYPQRTIFQFYTVAMVPFLVLALTFALRDIAGTTEASGYRRLSGQRVVWVFLVVVALLSAFWYPVWTGITVPYDFWRLHNWMPVWI